MTVANYKRSTAEKIKISDLVSGDFIRSAVEFEPSYVHFKNKDISRVNMIGTVVDVSDLMDSFSLDDSSGVVEVRIFDNSVDFDFMVGDLVNVIAKPREFNGDINLLCEVIKKIDNIKWFELRKKELEKIEVEQDNSVKEVNEAIEKNEIKEETVTEDKEEIKLDEDSEEDIADNPAVKVISTIKKLDVGEGVDVEDVVKISKIENAEELINKLLVEGELFEVKSGRLKVLE